jgi:hypothetical protein
VAVYHLQAGGTVSTTPLYQKPATTHVRLLSRSPSSCSVLPVVHPRLIDSLTRLPSPSVAHARRKHPLRATIMHELDP